MASSHISITLQTWESIRKSAQGALPVTIDGQTLTLADVITVSCHLAQPVLTQNSGTIDRLHRSVEVVQKHLEQGKTVYGVNTGFGGSANVRTADFDDLQDGLVQHLNVGILLPSDRGLLPSPASESVVGEYRTQLESLKSHALPDTIVRAMLFIRCNSLARGHSGVRLEVVERLMTFLQQGIIPVVPLRGSISASGDLSSLSYVAGLLEGNPGIYAKRTSQSNSPLIRPANEILSSAGLEPLRFHAKEALGITNGTAASTGAAALAMYQANQLGVLTQVLTAMATEALLGTADNYDPFISQCRPHEGQAEAARNISSFLNGSKLASSRHVRKNDLAQDRYALRTAPQWLGPQLENLVLAHKQVETEINSTTDNPLVDIDSETIHHGGNFQAAAITSAMEKVTLSLQAFGKLLFAQCSETLDCGMNKGLPPNLAVDDPSKSFTMKGFDVNMAAYMSELAHLAHPISAHVQSTEMHNQSVNSMALVAARIALDAVEIVSLMAATYIYVLCQAVDLRCLEKNFEAAAEPAIKSLIRSMFQESSNSAEQEYFEQRLWSAILTQWVRSSHMNLADRGYSAARQSVSTLCELLHTYSGGWISSEAGETVLSTVESFVSKAGRTLHELYSQTRSHLLEHGTTQDYLGRMSSLVYDHVRNGLQVPMHRGLEDHPTRKATQESPEGSSSEDMRTLGTMASTIYESLRGGSLYNVVLGGLSADVSRDAGRISTRIDGDSDSGVDLKDLL